MLIKLIFIFLNFNFSCSLYAKCLNKSDLCIEPLILTTTFSPCEQVKVPTSMLHEHLLSTIEKNYCNPTAHFNFPFNEKNFDLSQAKIWLLKFSKPKGYNPNQDFIILKKILESGSYQQFPNEFNAARLTLAMEQPLYETQFFKDIPYQESTFNTSCLLPKEKTELGKKFIHEFPTLFEGRWPELIQKYLLHDELEDAIDKKAEELAKAANFGGYNMSEVYKVANQAIRKTFGLPYKEIHLFTTLQTNQGPVPTLISTSTSKPKNSEITHDNLGFSLNIYSSKIPETTIQSSNFEFETITNSGEVLKSKFVITATPRRDGVAKKAAAPPYAEMLNDKELNGMVIAGSNLESELTDETIREYIDYYKSQAYKLSPVTSVENLKQFLQEKLTNDHPVDYLIKEAHTDGDTQNLFKTHVKGKVIHGTRTIRGITENIDIVYPDYKSKPEIDRITNNEFGDWIKIREQKNLSPLYYINSSCWSSAKAISELSTANSPTLIELPTLTSMATFENAKDNPMRAIVDGLLKKQTYAQMRKTLLNDPEYIKGTDDVFIFPDEKIHQTEILDKIPMAYTIQIETTFILDGKEAPYEIPSAH